MTIRDPSTPSETEAADPHRYRHRIGRGAIEVEETSGVAFAEATMRPAVHESQRGVRSQAWQLPKASLSLALLAGALIGWAWRSGRRATRARAVGEASVRPDGAAAQLEAMARHAGDLIGQAPCSKSRPGSFRCEAERLRQVIDAQHPPLREGEAAPLSEPIPDDVPMTGEEDPIVEVDDADFADVVAAFMRSEREAKAAHGEPSRVRLARALLPFADATCAPSAVFNAIEEPFASFASTLATDPQRGPAAADIQLVETLIGIVARATHEAGGEQWTSPGDIECR